MRTEQEINKAIDNVPVHEASKYPSMTYEQGVRDALDWVLEDLDNDEFEYAG